MHEFDLYITDEVAGLLNALNRRQNRDGKYPAVNPRYKKIQNQRAAAMRRYRTYMEPPQNAPYNRGPSGMRIIIPQAVRDGTSRLQQLRPEMREYALAYKRRWIQLGRLLLNTPSRLPSEVLLRYHYVRYADDWLLLVNGPPAVAKYIKNKTAEFLKYHLGLTLSLEKTKITDIRLEPARFLSFSIRLQPQHTIKTKTGRKRVGGVTPYIGIDHKRLLTRIQWKGFANYKGRPREQPALSLLPDHEIVNKYNSIITGTVNYYAPMIRARSSLNHYVYIYEYSCYKTLCQRHRTTIRKLLKKHGHPLTVPSQTPNKKGGTNVTLLTTKHYWSKLKEISNKIRINLEKKYEDRDPSMIAQNDFLNNAKPYLRTQFKLNSRCIICGDTNVCTNASHQSCKEVFRPVRAARQGFARILSLLNRKQVPVCPHHHKAIHDGRQYIAIGTIRFTPRSTRKLFNISCR